MNHKHSLKILLTAALTIWGIGAASGQQTRLLTAEKGNDYGIAYNLPTTAFEVEVKALHKVNKAGPFYPYAKKYLGTDKVVTADSEEWSIEEVRVHPVGEANYEQEYVMQLKAGALTEVCVASSGMLLGVNCTPQPDTYEPLQGSELTASSLTDSQYLQYVDGDFLACRSTAKRAELLAHAIMDVREARVALSMGTAETMPADGRQLELMLSQLTGQENAMRDAFVGTVQTQEVVNTYRFIPDPNLQGQSILFRFSDFCGFVDSNDLTGAPVYLNFTLTSTPELPIDDKGEPKKLPKDGVTYIIPAQCSLSLQLDGTTLWSAQESIAQGGITFALDPKLFTDKKAPSQAEFSPTTGALIKVQESK